MLISVNTERTVISRNKVVDMINVTPVMKKFIVHMGEMGGKWGINRTVAQIHCLLYLSPKPLNAEEIVSILKVARSNVSSSLRELQGWKVVKVSHVLGDRREYYESMKDVFGMFKIIMDERKKREVDPVLEVVKECIKEIDPKDKDDRYTYDRLSDFNKFFEVSSKWYNELSKLPIDKIMKFTISRKKSR